MMIKTAAPAYVVIEGAVAHTEIGDDMTSICHNPEIPSAMMHPALQQSGLVFLELPQVLLKLSRIMNGKNRDAPSPRIPFEHQWVAPRNFPPTRNFEEDGRRREQKALGMPHPQLPEKPDLAALAPVKIAGFEPREPIRRVAGDGSIAGGSQVDRQDHPHGTADERHQPGVFQGGKGWNIFFRANLRIERYEIAGAHTQVSFSPVTSFPDLSL
jgi:hypothetical protein